MGSQAATFSGSSGGSFLSGGGITNLCPHYSQAFPVCLCAISPPLSHKTILVLYDLIRAMSAET